MGLIQCHECGKGVSTEAKTCPGCGARVRLPKRPSRTIWFIAALLVIAVMAGSFQEQENRTAQDAKTPAEKAKDAKAAQRALLAATAIKTIREAARNPQSIQWVSVFANEAGTAACLDLRAQNGFGGMSREQWVLADGKITDAAAVWNKQCVGKNFYDVKELALVAANRLR